MKTIFSVRGLAALAAAVAITLGTSSAAHANGGDTIYWSIGMSSPGVQIGVSNGQVMVRPPIYVVRPPIYMPPVVYGPPGWHHRKHHGHPGWQRGYGQGHREERRDFYGRHERNDHHNRHDHNRD